MLGESPSRPRGDLNVLLGIDAEDDIGELRGDDGAVDVAGLVNNFDQRLDELELIVEEILDADDDILTADVDPGFDLEPGETTVAEVACAEDERVGERDVQFGVDASRNAVDDQYDVLFRRTDFEAYEQTQFAVN